MVIYFELPSELALLWGLGLPCSVELRGVHGDIVAIGEGREVLADANLLAQDAPTPQEAAVKQPDGDFDRALSALNSGTDPFANLDPTGAGLGSGGDSDSHSFVRLFRISETLDPLSVPTVSSTFERPLVDVVGGQTAAATATPDTTQAVNHPPIADPLNIATPEDQAIDIPLAGVVHDPDGDPTFVVGTPTAEHGTVIVNPDGSLHYTPNPDYNGPDTIFPLQQVCLPSPPPANTVTVITDMSAPIPFPSNAPPQYCCQLPGGNHCVGGSKNGAACAKVGAGTSDCGGGNCQGSCFEYALGRPGDQNCAQMGGASLTTYCGGLGACGVD